MNNQNGKSKNGKHNGSSITLIDAKDILMSKDLAGNGDGKIYLESELVDFDYEQFDSEIWEETPDQSQLINQDNPKKASSISPKVSLRTKAIALAIAIGTLPVIAIGATAYYFGNSSITKQILDSKQDKAIELADKANRFMFERYGDIQIISKLPILSDPTVAKTTSLATKQAQLNNFQSTYRVYDSIAVFDLKGNLVFQSNSNNPVQRNYANEPAFQTALKTGKPVISDPKIATPTGKITEQQGQTLAKNINVEIAAPIKQSGTGQTIGVVVARMPSQSLEEVIKNLGGVDGDKYYLINSEGKFFVALEKNKLGLPVATYLPNAPELIKSNKLYGDFIRSQTNPAKQLVYYAPFPKITDGPDLVWGAMFTTPPEATFAAQRRLLLTIMLGTGVTALLVGAIAVYLANRATRPILDAASAVKQLGQGELDTRIRVQGDDEIAVLGSNINLMAEQLQQLIEEKQAEANRFQLLVADLTLRIRESLKPKNIFNRAVVEIRQEFNADRVIIYRFDADWDGKIIAESVAPNFTSSIGQQIKDTCLQGTHGQRYQEGRVCAIDDIYNANLTDCHIRMLEQFQVKANLVVPILIDKRLFGLLIVHHCSQTHAWQQYEIDSLLQIGTQIGIALSQATLLKQVEQARQKAETIAREQRQQKESLQLQLVNLLSEVEGATRGNLTVRADVTEGEIGTVADFFNAVIESLRQIVTQVKHAATQVNVSLGNNEEAMRQVADEALQQAEEITNTLDSVEQMALSIQQVAASARQAAEVARSASMTAQVGGKAMDHTVKSILNLRETVAETAKKVKRLGESSQQISKVVSLINQIALQTNLLAINASIEAARAGEEGRGFAVVAEEVGELAAKSAAATKEIEQIVETIQQETSEVARAMEIGTTQVVEGTNLVANAKKSLGQIVQVSQQIDQLLQSISTATVSQAQTSESITNLMKEIAKVSERTSESSRHVSDALQETVQVAQELQDSVGKFQVAPEA